MDTLPACPPGTYQTYDGAGRPVCAPQPPVTVHDEGCPGCPWPGVGGGGDVTSTTDTTDGDGGDGLAVVAIAAALVVGTAAVAAHTGRHGRVHARRRGGATRHRRRAA